MSITCKICNQTFEKIIPWQHLKKHNISSIEYKNKYGNLYSDETIEKMSSKIPHNKGKKVTDTKILENIRAAVVKREERFNNNEIKRGSICSEEKKKKLSDKSKEYANVHPEEIKLRAKKAVETKIKNNYDFGKNMRGKKHSPDTLLKISAAGRNNNNKKIEASHEYISKNILLSNLTLISSLENNNLTLKCNNCDNTFSFTKQYFQKSKYKTEMCTYCFPRQITKSQGESELFEFVKSLETQAIQSYRNHYHDKEIDIFVPNKNIGFEYNGLYWHSESVLISNNKDSKSDYEKYKHFLEKGIRIYQIFEDEWKHKQEIVKSRIKNILGFSSNKIYARNCVVKLIDSKTSSDFINKFHIMGNGRSNVRLGLYYQDNLVSVMTFSKNNLSRKIKDWEINRFVSLNDTVVIGGASKLFKHFVKLENPKSVVSYADNRWSNGNLYKTLGFKKHSDGTPNYWYFLPNNNFRIHRFNLRKHSSDDQLLTEYENRLNQGYLRIWDCGSSKWVWNSQ